MYNEVQIHKLRIAAAHYEIQAPDKFWDTDPCILKKVCNGCGPECMRKANRSRLTNALSRYAPAFAVHDVSYEQHEGTRSKADMTMYKNMLKIWKKDFGFWRWLSIAGIFNRIVVIPVVYSAVRKFGDQAWKSTKRRLK